MECNIKEVVNAAQEGDKLEMSFIYFLHMNQYDEPELYLPKNKEKINRYRREFLRGYNHGFKFF